MMIRSESLVSISSSAINQIKSEAVDMNLAQYSDRNSDVQTKDVMYGSDHQNEQKYYRSREWGGNSCRGTGSNRRKKQSSYRL